MGPVSNPWAVRKPWETAVPVGQANRRRASESLDDVPHRPRLPSYPPDGPTHRPRDLYGSLSTLLGISGVAAALVSLGLNLDLSRQRKLDEGKAESKAVGYPGLAGFELEDGISSWRRQPGSAGWSPSS